MHSTLDSLSFSRRHRRIILIATIVIGFLLFQQGFSVHFAWCDETTKNVPSSLDSLAPEKAVLNAKVEAKPVIQRWERVEDLPAELAILDTVFWEPLDTTSLRRRIRETDFVKGKRVFELGTGSGLISLCCLKAGAEKVVATDVNPNAIECAAYNARRLDVDRRFELRQVEPGETNAYVALRGEERFDLIISNPPWEDGQPQSIAEYALYDFQFKLLDSILADASHYLVPTGEIYLAYGCKTAIQRIIDSAKNYGWEAEVLDDRKLERLDEVFLPGMMIRLYRQGSK